MALGSQAQSRGLLGLLGQVALPVRSLSPHPALQAACPIGCLSPLYPYLEVESRVQRSVARGPGSQILGPREQRRRNCGDISDCPVPLVELPEGTEAFCPVGLAVMSRCPTMLVKELRQVGGGAPPPCLKRLPGKTKVYEETGILGIKRKSRFLVQGKMLESSSGY